GPTPPNLVLGTDPVSTPASLSNMSCDHEPTRQSGCCATGCAHALTYPGWHPQLVIVGGRCTCGLESCTALCVLRDPVTGMFASLDHPDRWMPDVSRSASCHIGLTRDVTAYVVDVDAEGSQQICTSTGCRPIAKFLGWLVSGTGPQFRLPEDANDCPH